MSDEAGDAPRGAPGEQDDGQSRQLHHVAGALRRPERPTRPRVRRQDATIRGGIVGITAVIVATALLSLVGALITLVVALIY